MNSLTITEPIGSSSPAVQSSPALQNKRVVIGLIVIGLSLFFVMWLSLTTQSLFFHLDEPVNLFFMEFRQDAPDWLTGLAHIMVRAGSQGLTAVTIILLIIMAFRRQFHRFWLLFAAVGGGELLWLPLIFLIDRTRPTEVRAISGFVLPGFPSGHAMIIVAFFGALLYIYLSHVKKRGWRLVIVGTAAALFLITGFNRLYFNAHYLTDIIAGYGLGLAWTAFALTAVDWLHLKRQQAAIKEQAEPVKEIYS
jgi:undecaprenyl-diphosphatase